MTRRLGLTVFVVLLGSHAAYAQLEPKEMAQELDKLDRTLVHPAPGHGLDKAPSGPPRWCRGYRSTEPMFPENIGESLAQYRRTPGYQLSLVEAAKLVCRGAREPKIAPVAAEIEQYWINETGLSEADAVASIELRVDEAGWKAERAKLCSAITPADDTQDESHAMAAARMQLFGCDSDDEAQPVWLSQGDLRLERMNPFLDRGAMERDHDEIVRLSWLEREVSHLLEPGGEPTEIAGYAILQYDLKALSYDGAMHQLDAAPYRGNRFARVVLSESIGHAKLVFARLDAAIAKRTEDAKWKELLITAPARGAADWLAAAAKVKDALARSDEFARTAGKSNAPSGCEKTLRADLLPLVKALNHGAWPDIEGAMEDDPILGLLLHRLVQCVKQDGDATVAEALGEEAGIVGYLNGPRAAAYAATVKALNTGDRHKKPFDAWHDLIQLDDGIHHSNSLSPTTRGVVQSVVPVGKDGKTVKVTFVTEKYQYMSSACADGNKIDRIDKDGTVHYRQVCHDTGLAWATKNPPPTTIPVSCAMGVTKGRMVGIDWIGQDAHVPGMVWSDKSAKKILAAHCLAFE